MEAASRIDAEQICEIRFPGSWGENCGSLHGKN